ncbi:MAG: DUF1302 family protein [Gammaproteobacteria bacterium]
MKQQQPWKAVRRARHEFVAVALAAIGYASAAPAWLSADQSLEVHGFVDNTTHQRADYGLSKQRFRGQMEFVKQLPNAGAFTGISLSGTLRATYDGVYDWNSDDFGDSAGSGPNSIFGHSSGIPNGTALGLGTPWGASPISAGAPLPGGGGFGFNATNPNAPFFNPGTGLKRVGGELGKRNNSGQFGGGLEFYTPVRPCNVDSRGCLPGYMNASEDNLRMPEFTGEHRWLRELYLDATLPLGNGDEINFRVGRQQVVWGRTDLFRVLDQINPIDFSIQNIYEEFEDSRIPLGILSAEWRLGATGSFDDLNFQFIWNFEKFTPNVLGQGGQPYSILQAGDAFRALANCWDNGCTVSNFASGLSPAGNLSTDFPRHSIGIRKVHLPKDREQFGLRMEGVFKSVGFSFNALTMHSQLPSLRGGIPVVNPFLGLNTSFPPFDPDVGATEKPRAYVPAFDIYFPRVWLVGASADYYWDWVKSALRFELAYTDGEEFADTSQPRLFSESNVVRWVVGWDRPTYIRFLNENRTFLLSAQVFGQHLLDHERFTAPNGTGAKIGFQDWDHNLIATFLFQGFYMNDRLQPRLIQAYDVRAQAYVMSPGVDWLINDNWRVVFAANLKFGKGRNDADDGRTANAFPPFTCSTGPCGPGLEHESVGSRIGFEPLGRFRSGPIGMAQHEDELQLMVRYQF